MDKLKTIIHTFNTDDRREFLSFLKRQKKTKGRKDVELFNILGQKESLKPHQIVAKLYPENTNKVAYQAVRKRLFKHLVDFVVLKQNNEDTTSHSAIQGMLSLARYLFSYDEDKLAWEMLQKAELMATEAEQFQLLLSIYLLQIEVVHKIDIEQLDGIIANYQNAKQKAEQEERANIAYSLVRKKLLEMRAKGLDVEYEKIIGDIISQYQLQTVLTQNPRISFKLLSIARGTVIIHKDYHHFEPYLIENFEQLEKVDSFKSSYNTYYKLEFLYLIAQVLYWNKKFEKSLTYLQRMMVSIEANSKQFYSQFYAKYTLLSAANFSFVSKTSEAIELTESLLRTDNIKLSNRDRLNATLNLAFYHFHLKSYAIAIRSLMSIKQSDKWCEKQAGVEWVLKKKLSEVILQFELENFEIAYNKVVSIEKKYSTLLNTSSYSQLKMYLAILKEITDNPSLLQSQQFHDKVMASFNFKAKEEEDLQEVNFYAWLKAKLLKQDYYQVLLELTR